MIVVIKVEVIFAIVTCTMVVIIGVDIRFYWGYFIVVGCCRFLGKWSLKYISTFAAAILTCMLQMLTDSY